MTSACFSRFTGGQSDAVVALFQSVFTASEGPGEGEMVGQLVADLIATTADKDLFGYLAVEADKVVGAVFFSRFWLSQEPAQTAFILSPMAIASERQGCGLGQQLINFGLDQLTQIAVDLVFTYGDPAFYGKLGFTQNRIPAPYALSQPEGWLARPLGTGPMPTVVGPTRCVPALSDARYW